MCLSQFKNTVVPHGSFRQGLFLFSTVKLSLTRWLSLTTLNDSPAFRLGSPPRTSHVP
jgi:hypothetical protein